MNSTPHHIPIESLATLSSILMLYDVRKPIGLSRGTPQRHFHPYIADVCPGAHLQAASNPTACNA